MSKVWRESSMQDPQTHIPLADCLDRHVYRLHSRNLTIGVFDAKRSGFIGIRLKFDNRFLFMEYHWDTGPPYGTVRPLELLGPMVNELELSEYLLPTLDRVTGRPVEFDRTEIPGEYLYTATERAPDPPLKMRGWRFMDTGEYSTDIRPTTRMNMELFNYLDALEQK